MVRAHVAAALCVAIVAAGGVARASQPEVVAEADPREAAKDTLALWPTLTPAGDAPGAALHRPGDPDGAVALRAQELDATLREATQDLGFALALGEKPPAATRDTDVLDKAAERKAGGRGSWVVSPRIEAMGGDTFLIRLVIAAPGASDLRVRVATVRGADVAVRGLIMLRDALALAPSAEAAKDDRERERAGQLAQLSSAPAPRSEGRAVLAANGALVGAFLAFGLQRASVSSDANAEDPRVLLPLLTLGMGTGLGASLLAAEEWDVHSGDAWYLTAGTWWSAAAGFFIASGTDVQPLNTRYLWGAAGGLGGGALSALALSRGHIDEGGALLAHSGGALGVGLGSLVELMAKGSFDRPPPLAQGIGAAAGVAAMSVLATQWRVTPSRVLLLDLGAALGALAAAAASSPLIFGDPSPAQARMFLGATLVGASAGGLTAALLTRNLAVPSKAQSRALGEPVIGPIGASAVPGGATPIWGLAFRGSL